MVGAITRKNHCSGAVIVKAPIMADEPIDVISVMSHGHLQFRSVGNQ